MIFLALVFVGMFIYGVIVGKLGAALLALFVAGFTLVAARIFARREAAWLAHPNSAKVLKADTLEDLESHSCESARSKF